jgi:hypothetical protein
VEYLRELDAFGDWSFGDWSHSEIGRILGNWGIGRSGIGRSEIGRSEIGRSENGRSENGRCTKYYYVKKYVLGCCTFFSILGIVQLVPCSCASVARTCQALTSTENLKQYIMY